jgi:hypothetical protein
MADFTLDNVESLSLQKSLNYWGDIFYFNSTDVYNLTSRVKNSVNPEYSINPIWSQLSSKVAQGLSYYNFVLDGVSLGSGKITSFNWEPGTDVTEKKYSMTFEVSNSGDFTNLTGAFYSDIDKSVFGSGFQYVNNFEENFSVSFNQNKIQETTQTVSFEIDKPISDSSKIALKNKIFSGFAEFRIPSLGIRTLNPNIISGNVNSGYINYFNETHDIINSRFSFQKRSLYDNDQKATWEYSHSVQLNGGDANVVENGSIQSIYFKGLSGYRNLSGAIDRWDIIKTGIYQRVSGTFQSLSGFSGLFPSGYYHLLMDFPIDKRFQEDPMAGKIDYSYSYTNNPTYTVSGFIFSNSRSSSVSDDGYYIISEDGEYRGVANSNEERFGNAYSGYLGGESRILPRISGTFLLASDLNKFLCPPTGNFFLSNNTTTYKEYDGIVSYNNSYSNSPSYYPTGSNFIKYTNTISDKPPVHLYNKFLVPRQDEYIQSATQSTEGSYANNIRIVGKRGVSIENYLNEAFSKVERPTGAEILDSFLKSMNYSFDPYQNTFDATFEYYYSKYKEEGDVLV